MAGRHIVAMGGGGFSMEDPLLDRYVLDLVDKPAPRVCFIPTASGDADGYIEKFMAAFTAYGAAPSVLRLFQREVADIGSFLGEQDLIYVGGGSTVNMLKIWEIHGVDKALRMAWATGVVLAGISAGANCWFEAFTTDSFGVGTAQPAEGLGFIKGSFTPHYSNEPARRPSLLELVASGGLPDGYACDDYAAIHFAGSRAKAIVSRPEAAAYRLSATDDPPGVSEVLLTATYLGR